MGDFKEMLEVLNEEEKELFLKYRYGYIFEKAKLFLKIGEKEYFRNDFFELDTSDLDDEDFKILRNGCRQILAGRGLTSEKPFENLDVLGFAKLFEIFHFSTSRIKTLKPEPMKFLDVMSVDHMVDGYKMELYNLITY